MEKKIGGIYVLFISARRSILLKVGALGKIKLSKGTYAYVGSAQNGIKMRVASHLFKTELLLSKVAKELLKKRHIPPKSLHPDRYPVGGHNEAFYYWEISGILWEDPEIKEWLTRNRGKGKRSESSLP